MDKPAEHIAASDISGLDSHRARSWSSVRNSQRQAAVGPLLVVVTHVGTKDSQQMPPADHKRPVKTLRPHTLHPPLGIGVGLRSPDRGWDDLCALGAEHLVEGTRELGVVVTKQEPDRPLG